MSVRIFNSWLVLMGTLVTRTAFAQGAPPPQSNATLQLQAQTPHSKLSGKQGRAGAVMDLTGYWVAVINEDWRWRMILPDKGDFSGIPLTIEGRRVADIWDPSKTEAAGAQCSAYAAPSLMRIGENRKSRAPPVQAQRAEI